MQILFTDDWLAGLFGNANEIDIVLIAFPKIGKKTKHGW